MTTQRNETLVSQPKTQRSSRFKKTTKKMKMNQMKICAPDMEDLSDDEEDVLFEDEIMDLIGQLKTKQVPRESAGLLMT